MAASYFRAPRGWGTFSCPAWGKLLGPLLSPPPSDLGPRVVGTVGRIDLWWTFPSLPPSLPASLPHLTPHEGIPNPPPGVWNHWNVAFWPWQLSVLDGPGLGNRKNSREGGRVPHGLRVQWRERKCDIPTCTPLSPTRGSPGWQGCWASTLNRQLHGWRPPAEYSWGEEERIWGERRGADQHAGKLVPGGDEGEDGAWRSATAQMPHRPLLKGLPTQSESPVLLHTLTLGRTGLVKGLAALQVPGWLTFACPWLYLSVMDPLGHAQVSYLPQRNFQKLRLSLRVMVCPHQLLAPLQERGRCVFFEICWGSRMQSKGLSPPHACEVCQQGGKPTFGRRLFKFSSMLTGEAGDCRWRRVSETSVDEEGRAARRWAWEHWVSSAIPVAPCWVSWPFPRPGLSCRIIKCRATSSLKLGCRSPFLFTHVTLYRALGAVALVLNRNVLAGRHIRWTCKPGYVAPLPHLIETKSHQGRPSGMAESHHSTCLFWSALRASQSSVNLDVWNN